MPKFDLYSSHGTELNNLKIVASEGDFRYQFGILERCDTSGNWLSVGNIDLLFRDVDSSRSELIILSTWMHEQKEKEKDASKAIGLEEQFDDLKEAGEYLRVLEKATKVARLAYKSMTEITQAKLKTFEILDTDFNSKKEDEPF